jgi:hypothetical protein
MVGFKLEQNAATAALAKDSLTDKLGILIYT